jgi:hypothetical protein
MPKLATVTAAPTGLTSNRSPIEANTLSAVISSPLVLEVVPTSAKLIEARAINDAIVVVSLFICIIYILFVWKSNI